jgi:hypothetical protein
MAKNGSKTSKIKFNSKLNLEFDEFKAFSCIFGLSRNQSEPKFETV